MAFKSAAAQREHYASHPRQIETYVAYEGQEVIYVGRTDLFWKRMEVHRKRGTEWLSHATEIVHRNHSTYGDSLVDEAMLIRHFQPRYNVIGVRR